MELKERVARAICKGIHPDKENWRRYKPQAQVAMNEIADWLDNFTKEKKSVTGMICSDLAKQLRNK
jgi:hypothetical protein